MTKRGGRIDVKSKLPHYLRVLQNIEKTTSLVNMPLMKAMEKLQPPVIDPATLKAAEKLQSPVIGSATLKAMEKLQSPVINPATLKAMEGIQSSIAGIATATLKSLEGIQSSLIDTDMLMAIEGIRTSHSLSLSTVKSLAGIRTTGLFNSLNLEALAGIPADGILNLSAIDTAQLTIPSINSSTLTALQSFQTDIGEHALDVLKQVENFPFNSVVEDMGLHDLSNKEDLDIDERNKLEKDLLKEVVDNLNTSKEFQSLSVRSKEILLYFYHSYILPFLIGITLILNQGEILEIQGILQSAESPDHVKKLMKSQTLTSNSELLKGYRVTKGRLNLRIKPKMQSDVIITLPRYTLLYVIDSSKRSWIYVQVQIDDELIEGWVSRRHTAYFK